MKPTRFIWGCVTAGILACSSNAPTQPDTTGQPDSGGVKRAVLIGIDDYHDDSNVTDLKGAVNDVELMQTLLVGKFGFDPDNIVVLTNEQATHQAIVSTISSHLGQSQAGDVALVHYSGHGSQMFDSDGDEPDRMDETIVPHDSRQGGVFDISDDQINDLMSQLSAKTDNVVFVLDSCHSGTAARAADALGLDRTARFTPADQRPPPQSTTQSRGQEGIDDFRLPGANYVLISGSKANELSNETRFGLSTHGAMTYYLAQAMRSAGPQTTYRDVVEQAQADVTARFDDQHPQIEGTGIDTAVFGVEQVLPQPYLLVNPVGNGQREATIAAGEVFGLSAGSVLDVFPPGTKRFDGSIAAIAQLKVRSVQPFAASAEVLSGQVQTGSRSVLDEIRSPDFQVGVFLDELPDGWRQRLTVALTEYESIRLLEQNNDADLVAGMDDAQSHFLLRGRGLAALSRVPLSDSGAEMEAIEAIAHWARWNALLALRNPSPDLSFDLTLRRVDGDTNSIVGEQVPAGAKVEIKLTNTSNQNVFPVLLDLTDKGRVGVIYPPANIGDPLPPGQSFRQVVNASVPEGSTTVTDFIKAIVTTQPISASSFKLNPLPRDVPPPQTSSDGLQRYFTQFATGQTRDLTPVPVTGWATQQRVLRVTRSDAQVDGFAAIFADEGTADQAPDRLSDNGSRSICGSPLARDCYEVIDAFDDDSMRLIVPPQVRSGDRSLDSVGNAFDQAYEIMDDTGARRVEPLFELELPRASTAPNPADPGTRGLGSDDPLPRAVNDDTWSLKYARVPEAWVNLRADGKPEGAEAEAVVIAHPDTGYLEHAEIWGEPDERPLWPDKGYDYHDNDHSPVDERVDSGLANPVHGTGSSSAIISPAGCQLADVEKCPTGVAQGAHLVPLRINVSVVNFSTRRLAQALLDASGINRERVKVETDLASIAMGGPPSWTLWRTVKKAEERGYIIVAAAGNYVRTVVWPARFRSVISIAAVNAECRPWKHSSRGSKVDIAAPGESVWRATMAGDDHDIPITGMGTGTTYGTATTSGVVALWVAKHKGSAEYEALKQQGKLTDVLLSLLQSTAWRPNEANQPEEAECADDADWDDGRYGAGIVDAEALLNASLSDVDTGGDAADDLDQLPLWWSMYTDGESLQQAHRDFVRVFPQRPPLAVEDVAHFESEIMHHYATDEATTEAIDQVRAGRRTELAYRHIRMRLLQLDSSNRLRAALD